MATNAFEAKANLRDMLKAQPELAKYQVTWGYPSRAPERRWIFVGEVTWKESEWATNRSREEQFFIALVVNCQLTGGTSEEVERELQTMASGIENALKANPSLGIASAVTSDFIPQKLSSYPSDSVYEGQLECQIRVKARL